MSLLVPYGDSSTDSDVQIVSVISKPQPELIILSSGEDSDVEVNLETLNVSWRKRKRPFFNKLKLHRKMSEGMSDVNLHLWYNTID